MSDLQQPGKPESFGQRLRRLREERNLSIKEMAEKVGVPLTTYREWEYGRAIKGEPYVKIAQALAIGLGELLCGEKPQCQKVVDQIERIEQHLSMLKNEIALHMR